MQEYRLYVFERGRVRWPDEFTAPDDAAAILLADESWMEGRQMELWTRDRMVRSWGFPNSAPPAQRS